MKHFLLSGSILCALVVAGPATADAPPAAWGNVEFSVPGNEGQVLKFQGRDGNAGPHGFIDLVDGTGTSWYAEVDCVRVVGSTGFISGPIVETSRPSDLGKIFELAVRDGGSGPNAGADLEVHQFFTPGAGDCRTHQVPYRTLSGQVHVRA